MFIKIGNGYLNLDQVNFIEQDEENKNALIFYANGNNRRIKIFKTESELSIFLIYLAQNQFDKLQGL
jgi:hypothetical protein